MLKRMPRVKRVNRAIWLGVATLGVFITWWGPAADTAPGALLELRLRCFQRRTPIERPGGGEMSASKNGQPTESAEHGKSLIDWSERRMPALSYLRGEFARSRPLDGIRVAGSRVKGVGPG